MSVPALKMRLSDYLEEYERKLNALPEAHAAFEQAQRDLKMAASIGETYGQERIDTGCVHFQSLETNLCRSAWLTLYNQPGMKIVMSAQDKKRFEQVIQNPPEFSIENIEKHLGEYITDPYYSILRGLAEVFCELDQSFKSHDRNKIGVDGLPKRIIISGFNWYSGDYGFEQVADVVNAIASYTGNTILTKWELQQVLEKDGKHFLESRGFELRRFQNGNGHLHFTKATLETVNKALAEFYGDVLPDGVTDKPTERAASTAVAKDLQYYPTPVAVVDRVLSDIYIREPEHILEPSCGCGRFLDGIKRHFPECTSYGMEVHKGRVMEARMKGHAVLCTNFLDRTPHQQYHRVIMNPPFYGRHYAKHVEHAMKFLRPGGKIHAILPVTARLDHGLIEKMGYRHSWEDLPLGSFRESGTNINTTVLTMEKPR